MYYTNLQLAIFLQINRKIREDDNNEREKARLLIGNKSPRNGPNSEQRNYCNKVSFKLLFSFVLQ